MSINYWAAISFIFAVMLVLKANKKKTSVSQRVLTIFSILIEKIIAPKD